MRAGTCTRTTCVRTSPKSAWVAWSMAWSDGRVVCACAAKGKHVQQHNQAAAPRVYQRVVGRGEGMTLRSSAAEAERCKTEIRDFRFEIWDSEPRSEPLCARGDDRPAAVLNLLLLGLPLLKVLDEALRFLDG